MIPSSAELRGYVVSTRWLSQQLSTPAIDTDEVTLEHSSRGFIIVLIGSFLFVDKKSMHVHLCFLLLLRDLTQTSIYNWGSAVLAHLYRELCRASYNCATEIVDCMTLLQVLINFLINIHI